MKTKPTNKGWDEIKTTHIEIVRIPNKSTLTSVEMWLDFNKKHQNIGRNRKTCNCCKKSWSNLEGMVNLVFTNKGNKSVCDDCLRKLRAL